MNRLFVQTTSLILVLILGMAPLESLAQTAGGGGGTNNQTQQQTNAAVRQQYNPNATIETSNGGRTFSGLSFSGVGGAIAGCTNIGGTILGGIGSVAGIFKNKSTKVDTPAGGAPPVNNPNTGAPPAAGSQPGGAPAGGAPAGGAPAGGAPGGTGSGDSSSGVSDTKNSFSDQDSSMGGQEVPVAAKKTDEELKKANKRESCLNGVAYAVAKGLLRQITDKTLNWVNTGFNGNPLYVRDLNSFLRTISDQRVSQFLDQIPSSDPVFGNAIRSIATEQISGIQDGLIGTVMDTPEARAYESFQQDFTNGGWAAFLDPKNNAVGAIFDAADELSTDINAEEEKAKTQLQNGNGFLDLQRCVEYADESPNKYPYTYKTYSCQKDIKKDADAYYKECLALTDGRAAAQSTCQSVTNDRFQSVALLQCVSTLKATAKKNDQKQCLRYETVTPGSIIQAQVETITTSPTRQLEQADQINEVLGAFFDQLLNKLISDGLASLRGKNSSSFSFTGMGSNVVLNSGGGAISNTQVGATALGYQQAGTGISADFDISRPQHLRAVLTTQYNYINRLRDARVTLNRIVPTLGALDYCVPGPTPTWQDGLSEAAGTFFGSFQEMPKTSGLSSFNQKYGSFLDASGLTGSLVSLIADIFGLDKPDSVFSAEVTLFDKVTDNSMMSPYIVIFHAKKRSTEFIFNNAKWRWEELMKDYHAANFTQTGITNAFVSVDPGNAPFATGFVSSTFEETSLLPKYSAGAFEVDKYYEAAETETVDAISRLEDIRAEANSIVETAKARYIGEQAAAGTPVNLACIDSAYIIDNRSVTPTPRQESGASSPFFNQFIEANNYFYNNL